MTHSFTPLVSHIGLLITLLAFIGGVPPAFSAPPPKDLPKIDTHEHAPDELLVKFRRGTTNAQADAVAKGHGASKSRRFKAPRQAADAAIGRWWQIKLTKGRDLRKVMEQLARHPRVEAVERNYILRASATPNDPRYDELWGLNNIGQTGGQTDADIDAPEAWDLGTGAASTLVAVIDTGVDYAHPDLAANMWTNPGEVFGNGIDDDQNGYIDDIHGYDFINEDGDPFDDHGHGTHVAGTIAAVGNNGEGVVGVSWDAQIMALKFLGADGVGSTDDAIRAVLYATDMGARVTNNSYGGGGFSQAMEDAISAALEANSLFVVAAGNDYANNDVVPVYPASYNVGNVLAVAATDAIDAKPGFSNYGAVTVDLGAPGVGILSTVPTSADPSGYGLNSGTSMASPHVAGAAALLLEQSPTLTALGLKDLLMASTDPIASLSGIVVSDGRLNVSNAMNCQAGQMSLAAAGALAGTALLFLDEEVTLGASVMDCGTAVGDAQVSISFSDGSATLPLYDDGAHDDGAAGDGIYGNFWTPTVAGGVTLTIDATHPILGTQTLTVEASVVVRFHYHVEPTSYEWIPVESGGDLHAFSDDQNLTVPIGFDFEFYGNSYSELIVHANGFLTLDTVEVLGITNWPIPTAYLPNALIAPWWIDWRPASWAKELNHGLVGIKTFGKAPNRKLVVAYNNWPIWFHQSNAGGRVTFEAILLEGSNEIIFQYQDTLVNEYDWALGYLFNYGGRATIGLEDMAGTQGFQYSYAEQKLSDGLALRFYPGGPNARPVANAGGPYQAIEDEALIFDGSGSTDPENDPLTYSWDFGDDTTGTGVSPTHTYTRKGDYTVTLVVNDGQQDSLATTATVTVSRAP